ncbi:hypothetical protein AC1031_020036 [Aphanomyces cochlioides]|nr:hypothetical protein AC1031_020036 [Aphanomyces cochlioides]
MIKASNGAIVVQADVSPQDFDVLKVLAKGRFGIVLMVRKKDDEKIYAVKTLLTSALTLHNPLLQTENIVLLHLNHPFLTKLSCAIHTPDKLFVVTEFCPGNDLSFWLSQDRRFSEGKARLIAAEILLALQELHSHDIIYGDLKPQNTPNWSRRLSNSPSLAISATSIEPTLMAKRSWSRRSALKHLAMARPIKS